MPLNPNSKNILHAAALESEMLQRVSYFQKEINKWTDTQNVILEQTFSSAYFLKKTLIANRQFVSLLNHIEKIYKVERLKYFAHRSRGAQIEIFEILGQTMKNEVLRLVRAALVFGTLNDEVANVSVAENLVTFIQYFGQEWSWRNLLPGLSEHSDIIRVCRYSSYF